MTDKGLLDEFDPFAYKKRCAYNTYDANGN